MKTSRTVQLTFLSLIVLLAFGVRAYKLTESPGGLYIDETSIGFNAYSILTTGMDEHGAKFPLFFEAFGEYKLPLYIYLVVLSQLFLGPTDLSVRLPALILGTLLIPVFYLLLYELTYFEKNYYVRIGTPLLGAFMLAVSPWHFFFSRPGFEGGVGLFLVVLGLWLFFKSVRVRSLVWLIAAYLSFALALYTYNSARLVVPLSMVVLFFLYFRKFNLVRWVLAVSLFILITFPFWRFSLSSAGEARARQISILYQPAKTILPRLGRNFMALLSPRLWFVYGSPIIKNDTRYRMPLVYRFDALFILAGTLLILRRQRRELLFMLFFFFLGLVPSAVTKDSPHSLRAIYALPTFLFLAAYGLGWILSFSKKPLTYIGLTVVYVAVILVSLVHFLSIFHGPYVRDAAGDWQVNYRIIGEEITKLAPAYNRIYFADGFNLMALWWYLHIEPEELLETTDRRDIGKYQFGTLNAQAILVTGPTLYVGSVAPPNGDLIAHIELPNGDRITSLWDLRLD